MAIHIDILAHLNQRKLMMEGEQLKRYVDSLESDINRRLEKGAIGRSAKVVRANNQVLASYDRTINASDAATRARERETLATESLAKAEEEVIFLAGKLKRARAEKSIQKWTEALEGATKGLESAKRELKSSQLARVRAEQAAAKSTRDLTLAKRVSTETSKAQREADAAAARELEKLTSVQEDAKKALVSYGAAHYLNEALIRREIATNKNAIESTRGMQRGFDNASESLIRYGREHQKTVDMMNSGKVTSAQLAAQVERTGDAYRAMERNVRDATRSLRTHLAEEAKSASQFSFGRGRRGMPDPAGAVARNLGALTPLGTVTPALLLPLGTGFVAVAQGIVAAANSLWLLPAALTAGAAGMGTMKLATMGLSDAFTAMMDFNNPDKFAESLRLLSPAAQQFMLSVQQLVPAFMEVKNAVQDTFFAGMPQLVNGLARTYRDAFGDMSVGVAQVFNEMFMTIGNVLQDPKAKQSVGMMFDGIVESFRALMPMIGPLTQAFVQIASVGTQVLPSITDDIAGAVVKFSEFVGEATATGDLKKWMEQGWEAVKALGEVVAYTGRMLYDVFGLHGPNDIARFKETLFGLIDGFGVVLGAIEKFFHGIVVAINTIADSPALKAATQALAIRMSPVGGVLTFILDHLGGIETALAVLAGGGMMLKIGVSFYKWGVLIKDAITWLGLFKASLATVAPAAGAAGAAGGAAAAAGVTAAGAAAGGGFAAKAAKAIKGFGWVGIGLSIAQLLEQGLRDGSGGWRDALADGFDPGKILNPNYWLDKFIDTPASRRDRAEQAGELPGHEPGVNPPEPVWGTGQGVQAPGSLDSLGQAWGQIPDIPPGGFDVPVPNPGGGAKPDIPFDRYSLQNIPLGQFGGAQWGPPDPRSLMSQLTPAQLSEKGYGYVVDPQSVFDAESRLNQQRAAVEEARARVLELAQDNQATEQQKIQAQNNVTEQERSYLKSQVEYLEAQRGTWKKINDSIRDQTNMLDGLGAEIDADFGISKGLPGIAENLTKFLANLVAAPMYGALAGVRAAGGELGGGKGLIGAAALGGAFGPQYMQPKATEQPGTPATPTLPGPLPAGAATPGAMATGSPTSGAPLMAESGFTVKPGLNPKNVSTAGLQPQSMALLSLIQGMPQFAGIPLTSGYRAPGSPADRNPNGGTYPWHPGGRGLDLGLNANDPVQSALGDQLNSFLNANKDKFGIYNTLWKVKDHFDHLHIALKEGVSPLQEYLTKNGTMPPLAGGATSATGSLAGIPIPLPVTIVGGTTGTGGLPGLTPPSSPSSPSAQTASGSAGSILGGMTGSSAPAGGAIQVPLGSSVTDVLLGNMAGGGGAGTASAPSARPATVGAGGRSTEQAALDFARSNWMAMSEKARAAAIARGEYKPDGTPIVKGAAAPLPASLPSPGQGAPTPWSLPPLTTPFPATPAAGASVGAPPLAPGGYAPPGAGPTQIGAAVGPPEGMGSGFGGFSGGLLGAAQSAIGSAIQAAGVGADMMGGGGAGSAVAGALAQIGIEELNRAIAFAGQAAGIGVSGLMETFLPTGGSELANNNWFTRILGGVVGMRPLLPNFANISGAANNVQQGQNHLGNNQQGANNPANVNVTQNNYNQNGNSTTSDLEHVLGKAAAAPMPAMGAGR